MKSEGFLEFNHIKQYTLKILGFVFFLTIVTDVLLLAMSLYSYYILEKIFETKTIHSILLPTYIVCFVYICIHIIVEKRSSILSRLFRFIDHVVYEYGLLIGIAVNVKTNSSLPSKKLMHDINDFRHTINSKNLIINIMSIPCSMFLILFIWYLSEVLFKLLLVVILLYTVLCFLQYINIKKLGTQGILVDNGSSSVNSYYMDKLFTKYTSIAGLGLLDRLITSAINLDKTRYTKIGLFEKYNGYIMYSSRLIKSISQIIFLIANVSLLVQHDISISTFIIISVLMNRIITPLENTVNSVLTLYKTNTAYNRISLGIKQIEHMRSGSALMQSDQSDIHDIKAINISYAYNNNYTKPVLRNINVHIKSGCFYSVIGHNNCGITTFLKILSGIIVPHHGEVTFNNKSNQNSPFITFCEEENALLPGTILQNITRFNPLSKVYDVTDITRLLKIHDEIITLPAGYNTITQDYEQLSVSLRKKINIATIIFSDSKIMVFDNPSVYFDAEYDKYFVSNVLGYLKNKGKTLIIATNKEEIYNASDVIVLMKNGEIVKTGSKEEIKGYIL